MPIITLCNHKGGTGKTTSTINVAAALGLIGYKTLVIDLDPQSFLSEMLNLPETKDENTSLALFGMYRSLGEMPVLKAKNFDVMPSTRTLTKLLRNLTRPTDVFWIKETIESGHDYDFVLIDTAAAVTSLTINALVATQQVVIPVIPEFQSIIGGEQTWQTCKMVKKSLNPMMDDPLFLISKYDGRRKIHAKFHHYLQRQYPERVLKSVIRTDTQLAEKSATGSSIFDVSPQGRGAMDFANMADALLQITRPHPQTQAI